MTDDLISRADAISILRDYQNRQDAHIGMPTDSDVYAYARGMLIGICNNIKDIPSAQPKQGKWIKEGYGSHKCSCCHRYAVYTATLEERLSNYCPNCGARMQTERSE